MTGSGKFSNILDTLEHIYFIFQEGLLPKDIAEENGNFEMMKLLEDYKRTQVDKRKANSGACTIL